jgi:outer membrane immunogenic protein
MKRILLLSTALVMAGPAFAADVLVIPEELPATYTEVATDWTGFYIGVNGGVSQGAFQHPMYFTDEANPDTDYVGIDLDITGGGFIGGVQAGANFQTDSFVLGVEGDVQASSVEGRASASISVLEPIDMGGFDLLPGTTFGADIGTSLDWFGTLRARAGVLVTDQTLVYVTGGAAFGHTTTSINANGAVNATTDSGIPDDPATTEVDESILDVSDLVAADMGMGAGSEELFSSENDRVGYVVGAGIEYAITDNVTFKTEYLYTDLGSAEIVNDEIFSDFLMRADSDLAFHTVRAGVNLQF